MCQGLTPTTKAPTSSPIMQEFKEVLLVSTMSETLIFNLLNSGLTSMAQEETQHSKSSIRQTMLLINSLVVLMKSTGGLSKR